MWMNKIARTCHMLPEEKARAVIRHASQPSYTSDVGRIATSRLSCATDIYIDEQDCREHLSFLFLVIPEKNEDNQKIFNVKELAANMQATVRESPTEEIWPAKFFRYPRLFIHQLLHTGA
ncbi:hypothetical protein NPIL_161631 [Nephila pilipes]|uniref:Uncharacterized protein n=1 Tax=Nephila pilipes TaxID=299642 RepID=A0A8X6IDB2_NEPPI|nr:hypothetical protein NPIL_161631 [Nephila pilipes]